MNRQRGFLGIGPVWILAGVGGVIVTLMLGLYIQTVRLTNVQHEYAEFKAEVAARGRAAEQAARDKTAQDIIAKENANAENEKTIAELRATIKRLRAQRAASSTVPAAPAGSTNPERASFDRAQLERAIGEFVAEAQRIADRGSEAVVNLNTAKQWAQGQPG